MRIFTLIAALFALTLQAQDTVFVSGQPRNITIIFTGQPDTTIQDTTQQDTTEETPQDTLSQTETDTTNYTIMAIGDSNTEGYAYPGSYRQALDSLLGSRYDFIGRKTRGAFADNQHEGYSGIDINAVLYDHVLFGNMFTSQKPDRIVLLVGTNDVNDNNGMSPNNDPIAQAPQRYDNLVKEIQAKNPDAKIICVSLPPIYTNQWGKGTVAKVDTFNNQTSRLIQQNSKAGTSLFWLDVSKNFNSSDFTDGLHLNTAALRRLAGYIYGALKNIE